MSKEIIEEFYDLIKEGHEAVINHEEVAEYRKKVEQFILQAVTQAELRGEQRAREEMVGKIERIRRKGVRGEDCDCVWGDDWREGCGCSIDSFNQAIDDIINFLKTPK